MKTRLSPEDFALPDADKSIMQRTQIIRLFSILGAFLVGFWLPLRMIGYIPSFALEIGFDLLISTVSALNIYAFFAERRNLHPRSKIRCSLS